ncbi:MAG TPA: hypothetical protein VEF76_12190 [Patescibacteria group bacterium]|nr:hypothetical protein [Patescibacteria group bacterium]
MNQKQLYIAVGAVVALLVGGGAYVMMKSKGAVVQQQAAPKVHPIHDDATFAKETKAYGMMPYAKAELEYEIYIPKDWTEVEAYDTLQENNQAILSRIALYRSPMVSTLQMELEINALKLPHEISAKYWLRDYILKQGFSPEGEVIEHSTKSASAYYVLAGSPAAPSSLEYIAARISGSWVLLATYRAPLPLRNYVKYLQKKTIDSFKVLYPKEEPIEDQKVFTLVDSIKFNYPVSWEVLAPDFRDMNRLTVSLQNKGLAKTVEGYVRILAVRRSRSTDFQTELDDQRKYFDNVMNLKITKLVSSDKSAAYNRFLFNRYEIYDVAPKKGTASAQEIHFLALGDKEWYVFMTLFTPKEQTNLYNWARNTQSFREIIKSVK